MVNNLIKSIDFVEKAMLSVIYFKEMLDQVIELHKDVSYFHIGCDEVYYKLTHSSCQSTQFNNDFPRAYMTYKSIFILFINQ